ncbi:exostosin family-domain-containing protein [Pelagophyceae sp. CCMP2097]|nr:exostosin family-domain-containing protein [Pelagophyceae sp. CCMP2097]
MQAPGLAGPKKRVEDAPLLPDGEAPPKARPHAARWCSRRVAALWALVFGAVLWAAPLKGDGSAADKFWSDERRDRAAFWARERVSGLECPKTYVYALPLVLDDFPAAAPRAEGAAHAPRAAGVAGLVSSAEAVDENANLLEVIVSRLRTSTRCRAKSAKEADLFLVPVLPRSKHWSEWSNACDALADVRWSALLEHLTPENARRHVFVFPRVAYAPRCAGWWARPRPTVRQFARVSIGGYEEFGGDFERSKTRDSLSSWQRRHPEAVVPRLMSAPYVGAVRWSAALEAAGAPKPWKQRRARKALFAYSATPHGSPNAVALRLALAEACRRAGAQCAAPGAAAQRGPLRGGAAPEPSAAARLGATLAKLNSTFCVEPPGLTPGRQSIVNALLLGCIPVLFASEQDALWPLHWGDWRADSRVLLAAKDVVGDPDALAAALRAIPAERVRLMQDTIAKRAHAMQYALDDLPGDALEVTLRGILAAAT